MKMEKSYHKYSENLVLRINELFHDLSSEQYNCIHPEIFEHENERWKRVAKYFFNSLQTNPITVVDIGTGTGFIPITIANLLKKEDLFICSDISKNILEVARKNINEKCFQCKFKYVKIEKQVPLILPFQTETIDIVVMNSVLHHIKDQVVFLNEIDRILKPDGLLFIAHEPNKYFYNYKFLIINPLVAITVVILKAYTMTPISYIYYCISRKKRKESDSHSEICHKINEILLKEKLIAIPLSVNDINKIIDIRDDEGFKPDMLLPGYILSHLETYNHLNYISTKFSNNRLINKYDNWLKKRFPRHGATFFAVLRKS